MPAPTTELREQELGLLPRLSRKGVRIIIETPEQLVYLFPNNLPFSTTTILLLLDHAHDNTAQLFYELRTIRNIADPSYTCDITPLVNQAVYNGSKYCRKRIADWYRQSA